MTDCPCCLKSQGDSWEPQRCLVCGAGLCDACLTEHPCVPIPPLWPNQEAGISGLADAVRRGHRVIVLQAACGSGKSRVMVELARRAAEKGNASLIVASRRLLIGAKGMGKELARVGVEHATIAAGFKENWGRKVSVASLQTLHSRVVVRQQWSWPAVKIVLPDEFHEYRHGDMIAVLVDHYLKAGAVIVLVSATPVGADLLGATAIVQAGRKADLLAAGKIVPCHVYIPEEPDLKGVRRNKVGEFTEKDQRRIFWQYVVHGDFVKHWRILQDKYGFDGDTLLWAPGVKESMYCAELFNKAGVKSAHVDGETGDNEREDLIGAHKDRRLKLLSSVGVFRAGVDLPWARHGVLLQACAAYSNYHQIAGRLMRASDGKALCVLQDHSGGAWRHGHPDEDRVWVIGDSDRRIAKDRQDKFEAGEAKEPIRCPECGGVRGSGPACPFCGHGHVKSVRLIRCTDGTLVRKVGNVFKKKKTFTQTEQVWRSCLYACAAKRMTVRQAAGWYKQRTGQWPQGEFKSAALPERGSIDWNRRVGEVYPWLKPRKKKQEAPQ